MILDTDISPILSEFIYIVSMVVCLATSYICFFIAGLHQSETRLPYNLFLVIKEILKPTALLTVSVLEYVNTIVAVFIILVIIQKIYWRFLGRK